MTSSLPKFIVIFIIFSIFFNANAQQKTDPKNQDEELGKVSWYRDYDEACALSKNEDKPILILFQEVPGCATCRNYGHDVLTNPMMVEAIENEFIPLVIFNNKGGKDKVILQKYNEPAWNNPVVRIVDENGENLVDRIAGNYSARGLYNAMVKTLKLQGKPLPEYIKLLGDELSLSENTSLKEKQYKMYCFWTGEKQLGTNEGVLKTQAGFNGGEVVNVTYDPAKINESDLNAYAKKNQMQEMSGNSPFRHSESDEDYYLQHTNFKYLPLSEVQKTKINSALGNGNSAEKFLSPKQLKWLHKLEKNKLKKDILYNKPFVTSWEMISSK